MKKNILLTLMLSICLSTTLLAQKPNQYKDSYNYKRAKELLENDGDKQEAMDFLQKEVAEHPKNGYAYYWMGSVYEADGRYGEALEVTNKAIPLLQKDKAWISYAYRRRARIHQALEEEQEALKDWALSLKANPKDTQTFSDRAEYYYRKGMYAESDADYDKICTYDPNNSYGYMGKGRNALYGGKYKEAQDLFSYGIKLDSSSSQSYAFRAEAYMKQGMMKECIDDIIKALDMDMNDKAYALMCKIEGPAINTLLAKLKIQQNKQPNEAVWPYYVGIVLEGSGKHMKAIDAYKESLKINQNDVPYGQIARCYDELGYFELALESVGKAIELDPEDEDYLAQKADLLYDMGRFDEAIAAYGEYIRLVPEFCGGYYRRAFMKDNVGDVDGAIDDYSIAIALEPSYAYSYLGRADMYMLKGDKEAAMNDYRMVVKLDTVISENNCAQYAYVGLGEYEKAKEMVDSILAKSSSPGNLYDAACLYARMWEKEASLDFLKRSFEKGYRRFAHIEKDDDLDSIREMDGFKALLQEYEKKYEEELREKRGEEGVPVKREEVTSEIPFTVEGGNCYVKCQINDLPMRFVFDTGASDVSLSMVEASFMMKNGYLSDKDVIGSAKYSDAIGNVSEGTVINLRKVKFGDVELDNVKASVVRNQKAPLLLGQTVLSRIGKIEIDNQQKVIKVRYMKEVK